MEIPASYLLLIALLVYVVLSLPSNNFFHRVFSVSLMLFTTLVFWILNQPLSIATVLATFMALFLGTFCLLLTPPLQMYMIRGHYDGSGRNFKYLEFYQEVKNKDSYIRADVVAVHGLGSDPRSTWSPGSDESLREPQTVWLRDFLPKDLEGVRIIAFNRDSRWKSMATRRQLDGHAEQLLRELHYQRQSEEEKTRPIIWIGHSFGGIIIKAALVEGKQHDPSDYHRNIAESTKAIVFMGTPHRGSSLTLAAKIICLFRYHVGSSYHLLEMLEPGSPLNKNLHKKFVTYYSRILPDIACMFETINETILGYPVMPVVSEDSAVIDGCGESIAMDKTHGQLQRIDSREDQSYRELLSFLRTKLNSPPAAQIQPQASTPSLPPPSPTTLGNISRAQK
ncbi:hypothetical protein H2203_007349 [Taxawa tesnikishii (nom. ined.)]|nr:hypothetical protein H2203_007349 [Dothideales sp. JES 119]